MKPEIQFTEAEVLRVLVVEDDPVVRFLIADALRDEGVTVIEASTADEAWEVLITGIAVDLVFTDNRMPGSMTGSQLAVKIRDHWPDLPVAMTSGDFVGEVAVSHFFRKPYVLEDVVTELRNLALAAKGLEQ